MIVSTSTIHGAVEVIARRTAFTGKSLFWSLNVSVKTKDGCTVEFSILSNEYVPITTVHDAVAKEYL